MFTTILHIKSQAKIHWRIWRKVFKRRLKASISLHNLISFDRQPQAKGSKIPNALLPKVSGLLEYLGHMP